MVEDKMICILKRVECSKDEWEDIEEILVDSEMELNDMLEQWAKVLEGYSHWRTLEWKYYGSQIC